MYRLPLCTKLHRGADPWHNPCLMPCGTCSCTIVYPQWLQCCSSSDPVILYRTLTCRSVQLAHLQPRGTLARPTPLYAQSTSAALHLATYEQPSSFGSRVAGRAVAKLNGGAYIEVSTTLSPWRHVLRVADRDWHNTVQHLLTQLGAGRAWHALWRQSAHTAWCR